MRPALAPVEADLPFHRGGGFASGKCGHSKQVPAKFAGFLKGLEVPWNLDHSIIDNGETGLLKCRTRPSVQEPASCPKGQFPYD